MVQFFPDVTLIPTLHRAIGTTLYYWLFTNNITPGYATILADFNQVTPADCVGQSVAAAAFTLDSLSGHLGRTTSADITFTALGSSFTAYGYYVTTDETAGVADGDLVLAARFDVAQGFNGGDTLNVTPTLALKMSV